MKNMKVKTFLFTLPLALATLVSCGPTQAPSSKVNSDKSENDVSESTSTQKQVEGKVTIKFWHTFGQTVVDALKSKIESFKKLVKENDGVDVEVDLKYQGGYDDIAKLIYDGYSVMNSPTIAVAYPDNVSDYIEIGKSAGNDFVVDLDKFISSKDVGFGREKWLGDEKDEDDFVEEFFEEGSSYTQPGTYSLPFLKSTEIMFYNLDLLIEVMKGYKPEFNSSKIQIQNYMSSISWDEFMDLCSYAKDYINADRQRFGDSFELPMWYDSDANYIITKMFQNNVPYSSIDANGKGKIEFSQGSQAYNQVIDLLDEARVNFANGLFTTKGIKNTYGSDFFTNEKCLFSIGSSGGSGYNFPQADAFELGVCRVPADNDNPLYVSQGPTLTMFNDRGLSQEQNDIIQLYAWKFMKYITNGRVNAELCVNGSEGYVPVRYSAYETRFFQEFMEEGERYAMCYKVVVNDVNRNGGYLVSKAFKGSATLRDECGSMLTASLNASSKNDLSTILDRAINNAKLKM